MSLGFSCQNRTSTLPLDAFPLTHHAARWFSESDINVSDSIRIPKEYRLSAFESGATEETRMEGFNSEREESLSSPQLSGREVSLRFHRSSEGIGGKEGSRDVVEIQKSKIAECVQSDIGIEFSSAKFEPLTRALKILGSINAEQDLGNLREAWREVDGLVNGVVEVHHVGFNASLQDYSKINKLLREAQHALHIIRRNLVVAQDDISVDKLALLDSYHKYAEILEMTKLIKDIEWVCGAIQELDTLHKDRDWNGCIKILVQASNTLAREEIVEIKALKGLISQVQSWASMLVDNIIIEAEKQAFCGQPEGLGQKVPEWSLIQSRHRSRRRNSRFSRFGSGLFGSDGSQILFQQYLEGNANRHSRSYSSLPATSAPIIDGHVIHSSLGVNESLVTCISQLGGVLNALKSIRQEARQKLRDSLVRSLHSMQNSQQSGFNGLTDSSKAEYVVKALLKKSENIFKSASAYIQQLVLNRISAPSSGLSLLQGEKEIDTTFFDGSDTGVSITLRECTILWENIQCELLHVLAAALGLRVQPNNDFDSGGMLSNMYWSNSPEKGLHDEIGNIDSIKRTNSLDHQHGIKFSVDEQLGAGSISNPEKIEGFSSMNVEHLIKKTIGEDACLVQSAPSLYLPVKHFVSKGCKYLDDMDTERTKGTKSSNKLSPVTEKILNTFSLNRNGVLNHSAAKKGMHKRDMLLTYIVDILRTDFVPNAYAECGHRTQAIIANTTMNLQYHTGTYTIANNTVCLVRDALKWASMASVIAPNVMGVLENSLGKVVESLYSQINCIASGSLALKMAHNTNVTHLMAQEPIAAMLGGPEWFVTISTPSMDSFLTSAIVSGFALGKEVWPKEMVQIFMDLRRLEKSSLILQNNAAMKSIVSIAYIGQNAELISDGIQKIVGSFSGTSNTDRTCTQMRPDETDIQVDRGLRSGLSNIGDRCRSLSGLCTRILRIEAILHVLYAIQDIVDVSSTSSIFESRIAQMAPKLASMDEVLTNHLPAVRREYIFAPLSGFCMKAAIFIAKEIPRIDSQIVTSITRSLAGVQPVLGSLGIPPTGRYHKAMANVAGPSTIEHAKRYYMLSKESFETIYDAATERKLCDVFDYEDWMSLVGRAMDSKGSQDEVEKFNRLFSK